MNEKLKDEHSDFLINGILSMKNSQELYDLFDDLCTIQELKAMAQRFWVAKMLQDGVIYQDIALKTGASTATISRVNRSLQYGSDGYKIALARIEKPDKPLF